MTEAVAVSGLTDDVPGSRIGGTARYAGTQRLDPPLLGSEDHVIDFVQLRARLPEGHGAGHVRVIALDHTAEVELDDDSRCQRSVLGAVVRLRSVLPEGHDRLERDPACPGQPHRVL